LNSLLKDTCGILENCHDGDLCTIDTAQYENNEWICKFEDICDNLMCDGSDGSCKQQMKLTASVGKECGYFGDQLSISGNVLVVGGYYNSEAAHIYLKRMLIVTAGHKQPSSLQMMVQVRVLLNAVLTFMETFHRWC
jgi:hypothetical protein